LNNYCSKCETEKTLIFSVLIKPVTMADRNTVSHVVLGIGKLSDDTVTLHNALAYIGE